MTRHSRVDATRARFHLREHSSLRSLLPLAGTNRSGDRGGFRVRLLSAVFHLGVVLILACIFQAEEDTRLRYEINDDFTASWIELNVMRFECFINDRDTYGKVILFVKKDSHRRLITIIKLFQLIFLGSG